MADDEKKERDEDEEDEDDEELSDEERRKRRWLRLMKERAEKDFKNGRKVDKGFEGAFGGQEGAHKYYRHHNFTFTGEGKIPIPEVRPTAVSGPRSEPQRWYPNISKSTETPIKIEDVERASDKLFKFMEGLSEDERREVWDIFYDQTEAEELPEDDLTRIEAQAKSDITQEELDRVEVEANKVLESGLMSTIFKETVEQYKLEHPDETSFYPERSDTMHPEKQRKPGHDIDRLEDGLGMY